MPDVVRFTDLWRDCVPEAASVVLAAGERAVAEAGEDASLRDVRTRVNVGMYDLYEVVRSMVNDPGLSWQQQIAGMVASQIYEREVASGATRFDAVVAAKRVLSAIGAQAQRLMLADTSDLLLVTAEDASADRGRCAVCGDMVAVPFMLFGRTVCRPCARRHETDIAAELLPELAAHVLLFGSAEAQVVFMRLVHLLGMEMPVEVADDAPAE